MARSRTAKYYDTHPEAKARRLTQQHRYDNGGGSTGRSKAAINKYKATLEQWKRDNKGSKPKGKIVEAVHSRSGSIRWAAGEAARKHNRGNEVRKRSKPSNPKGGAIA